MARTISSTGRSPTPTSRSCSRRKGFEIDRRKILLPDPIKTLGENTVPVKLHRDVTAQVKVTVAKDEYIGRVGRVAAGRAGRPMIDLTAGSRLAHPAYSAYLPDLPVSSLSWPKSQPPPLERTLPHNLDAERSVLGAILIDNEAFNVAASVIDARAFFRDAHRRIFDRMVALAERSQPIDLVTLKEELERAGELDEVGGPAYIASLVDGVPRATNVEYYAKIVKEKSTLRSLIFSANKILSNAYEADQEADLILDEAESAIFSVADDRIKSGFVADARSGQGELPQDRAALRAQELHHRHRAPASPRSTR